MSVDNKTDFYEGLELFNDAFSLVNRYMTEKRHLSWTKLARKLGGGNATRLKESLKAVELGKARRPIEIHKLVRISEETKIPFEVLFRTLHQYPTLYDPITRRYSLCLFDRDFVNRKIIWQELHKHQGLALDAVKEYNEDDLKLQEPTRVYRLTYTDRYHIKKTLIAASKLLPQWNAFVYDPLKIYSGHLLTIPIGKDVYNNIKNSDLWEIHIKEWDIESPKSRDSVIFISSFFATNTTYAYYLIKWLFHEIWVGVESNRLRKDTLIAYLPGTEYVKSWAEKMGFSENNNEIIPPRHSERIRNNSSFKYTIWTTRIEQLYERITTQYTLDQLR